MLRKVTWLLDSKFHCAPGSVPSLAASTWSMAAAWLAPLNASTTAGSPPESSPNSMRQLPWRSSVLPSIVVVVTA